LSPSDGSGTYEQNYFYGAFSLEDIYFQVKKFILFGLARSEKGSISCFRSFSGSSLSRGARSPVGLSFWEEGTIYIDAWAIINRGDYLIE